jgi:hypothetical protein
MSNNKQQTAVELFAEQIRNYKTPLNMAGVEFILIHKDMINRFEQQAKEIDKAKAFEIFKAGQDSMEEGGKGFDQYYNETYGEDNQ